MRNGQRDRRVAVQRKTIGQSDTGQPIETWSTLAIRWAQKSSLIGEEERPAVETLSAREKVRFNFQWDNTIAALSPLDRIICPYGDASNPPTRSIYDVTGVGEKGREDELEVYTFRRSDVSP